MLNLTKPALDYAVAAVAVILFIAAVAVGAKWFMAAGDLKRERAAHVQTRADLKQCEGQLAEANGAIDRQNARVQEWVGRAKEYADAAEKAQAEAKRQSRRYETTIARLRAAPPPSEQCPQTRDYVKAYLQEERGQ